MNPCKQEPLSAVSQDYFAGTDLETDLLVGGNAGSVSRSPPVTCSAASSNGYTSSVSPAGVMGTGPFAVHATTSLPGASHQLLQSPVPSHHSQSDIVKRGGYPPPPHPHSAHVGHPHQPMVQIPVGNADHHLPPHHPPHPVHLAATTTQDEMAIKDNSGSKMSLGLGSALRALTGQEEMFDDYTY